MVISLMTIVFDLTDVLKLKYSQTLFSKTNVRILFLAHSEFAHV